MLRPWEFENPPCRELGTDVFYADQTVGATTKYGFRQLATVKKVCGNCPFQKDCLDWGVKHESFGIWGGATEYERSMIRKKTGTKFKSLEKYLA
jgi:hypothetical protein